MKTILRFIVMTLITFYVSLFTSMAQTDLWITGSGVPGGTQKLVKVPSQQIFKFAGTLQPGEVKIMTTETPSATTKYLVPRYPDAYIVNNGIPFTQTTAADMPGWVVTFAEDRYRFTVDLSTSKLQGELFDAWDELFIVGGAVECGWTAHVMLPLERVEGERCTYTWTGELKNRTENVEPRRFKLMGQNAWEPKHLHPYTQDELPQNTTCLRTGGDDTKWQINNDGFYRITVDVFRETFNAEYLGTSLMNEESPTGIEKINANANVNNNNPAVYDLQGRRISDESNHSFISKGIYICNGKKIMMR